MKSVKRLLNEVKGEKAHKQAIEMGLKYKGFGYWADPTTGETKYKTVNDELQEVDAEQESDKAEGQPEGMPGMPGQEPGPEGPQGFQQFAQQAQNQLPTGTGENVLGISPDGEANGPNPDNAAWEPGPDGDTFVNGQDMAAWNVPEVDSFVGRSNYYNWKAGADGDNFKTMSYDDIKKAVQSKSQTSEYDQKYASQDKIKDKQPPAEPMPMMPESVEPISALEGTDDRQYLAYMNAYRTACQDPDDGYMAEKMYNAAMMLCVRGDVSMGAKCFFEDSADILTVRRGDRDVYKNPSPPVQSPKEQEPAPSVAPAAAPVRQSFGDPWAAGPITAPDNGMQAALDDKEADQASQDEMLRSQLIQRHGLEDVVGNNEFLRGKLGSLAFVQGMANNPAFREHMLNIDSLRGDRAPNELVKKKGIWDRVRNKYRNVDTQQDNPGIFDRLGLDNEENFEKYIGVIGKLLAEFGEDAEGGMPGPETRKYRGNRTPPIKSRKQDPTQASARLDRFLNTFDLDFLDKLEDDTDFTSKGVFSMLHDMQKHGLNIEDLNSVYGGLTSLNELGHEADEKEQQMFAAHGTGYGGSDPSTWDQSSGGLLWRNRGDIIRGIQYYKGLLEDHDGDSDYMRDLKEQTRNRLEALRTAPDLDTLRSITGQLGDFTNEEDVNEDERDPQDIYNDTLLPNAFNLDMLAGSHASRVRHHNRQFGSRSYSHPDRMMMLPPGGMDLIDRIIKRLGGMEGGLDVDHLDENGELVRGRDQSVMDNLTALRMYHDGPEQTEDLDMGRMNELSRLAARRGQTEDFGTEGPVSFSDVDEQARTTIEDIADLLSEDYNQIFSESQDETYYALDHDNAADDIINMMNDGTSYNDIFDTMTSARDNNMRELEERVERENDEDSDEEAGYARNLLYDPGTHGSPEEQGSLRNRLRRLANRTRRGLADYMENNEEAIGSRLPRRLHDPARAMHRELNRKANAGDPDAREGSGETRSAGASGKMTNFSARVSSNPNMYGTHRIPTLDADLKEAGLNRSDLHSAAYIAWGGSGKRNIEENKKKFKEKFGKEPDVESQEFKNYSNFLAAVDAIHTWKTKVLPNLSPGTIVYNTPIGGGAGNDMRANLYARMGFGRNSAYGQQGVVGKDGKVHPLYPKSEKEKEEDNKRRQKARKLRRAAQQRRPQQTNEDFEWDEIMEIMQDYPGLEREEIQDILDMLEDMEGDEVDTSGEGLTSSLDRILDRDD